MAETWIQIHFSLKHIGIPVAQLVEQVGQTEESEIQVLYGEEGIQVPGMWPGLEFLMINCRLMPATSERLRQKSVEWWGHREEAQKEVRWGADAGALTNTAMMSV